MGIREKLDARKTPRNLQGWLQLRLLAIVGSVPELAIYCKEIDKFPNSHQRYSIQ